MTDAERSFLIDVYLGIYEHHQIEYRALSAKTSRADAPRDQRALDRMAELRALIDAQPLAGVPFYASKIAVWLNPSPTQSRLLTMRSIVIPQAQGWIRKWDRDDVADALPELYDAAVVLSSLGAP